MPRANTEISQDAMNAVNEAARVVNETSNRVIDGTKAAAEVTRSYVGDSTQVSSKMLSTWMAASESALNVVFELQNAMLASSMSFMDTATKSNRALIEQWVSMAQQMQHASVEACRAYIHASEQLADIGSPTKK
jgi:hypothetical protein